MLRKIELGNIGLANLGNDLLTGANRALDDICKDVVNRHRITKARVLTIKVAITPAYNGETGTHTPLVEFGIETKLPGVTGQPAVGYVEDGVVKVSEFDDDARQRNIGELLDGSESEGKDD